MEEFPSVLLYMQEIKILLSNCFIQQQVLYYLLMDSKAQHMWEFNVFKKTLL